MTTKVSFTSKSGAAVDGLLAEPSGPAEGAGKSPAVILLQEWWGLNDHIASLAARLAKDGFLVVAPDLYHGKVAKSADEAGKLMTELDTHVAVGEIAGAAQFLKAHPRSNGNVGVIGFCMGGALSFASACLVDGLSAVVPFYGVPPAEKVDYAKVTAPILAHFARRDEWATVSKAEAIKKQLDALGKSMQLAVYDADHAFVNDTRPDVYDEKNAKLAWERTVAFLKQHLS